MDALTLLNQHIKVEEVLQHYDFDKITHDGDMIRSACKIHGGSNPTSFVINSESGLWYCHSECGGGDIYTLVQRMENTDFRSAVQWVAKFFNIDIQNLQINERKTNYLVDLQKWMKLMKQRKLHKVHEPFHINEEVRPVAKYRDFKPETLEKFGLGFVESVTLSKRNEETYTLRNRLAFPIIFDGIQVGISFRRTKSSDFPKWSHQPPHIETGELLYNFDNVKNEPIITIVEGILDVWAYDEIGVPAVATFGAHLSEQQYKLLLRTGADIILSYDGDEAGKKATKKVLQMLKNKATIKRVVEFEKDEDPQSIGRLELKKRYGIE